MSETAITKNMSKRILVLKGMFIVCVLFLHSYQSVIHLSTGDFNVSHSNFFEYIKTGLSCGIGDIGVPGFFVLSSFLFYRKERDYKDNLRKKVKSLLLPFFVINSVWICIFGIANKISFLSIYFTTGATNIYKWDFIDWLDAYTGIVTGKPFLYPMWFVLGLFFLNCVSPLYNIFVCKFPKMSLVTFLGIWFFIPNGISPYLSISGICFWGIGCWVSIYYEKVKRRFEKVKQSIVMGTGLFLLILDICYKEGMFSLCIHRGMVLVGVMVCVICSEKLRDKPIMDMIGKYSFGIFILHEFAMSSAQKIVVHILPNNICFQVLSYFLLPVLVGAVAIIICKVAERTVPKVYFFMTGGR